MIIFEVVSFGNNCEAYMNLYKIIRPLIKYAGAGLSAAVISLYTADSATSSSTRRIFFFVSILAL